MTDTEILKAAACVHPKYYLGCRVGKSTRFAVIDIDANSKYHNKRELHRLLKALSETGLAAPAIYRSSSSGGWHIYLFFDEPMNSVDLRRQLVDFLRLKTFDIKTGTLEVFPNPGHGSLGYGLRLPLQPGFAWLDTDLAVTEERDWLSPPEAMQQFIWDLWDHSSSHQDFQNFKTYIQRLSALYQKVVAPVHRQTGKVVPIRPAVTPTDDQYAPNVRKIFRSLPPGMNTATWWQGRCYYETGLTGDSQRAEAIHDLSHYLFYGDPSRPLSPLGYGYEDERDWVIRELLDTKHNGHSKDINKGRHDAIAQISRATHWLPQHKRGEDLTPFTSQVPIKWVRGNAKRKSDARERITDAVESLKKLQRSFTTVQLQEAAECSRRTLYKHSDLWRQDYEDLAEGFFAICTGEYNAVVGGVCSASDPPSSSLDQDFSPCPVVEESLGSPISLPPVPENFAEQKKASSLHLHLGSDWHHKVQTHTSVSPDQLDTRQLKAVLAVLLFLLRLSPTEEDQLSLITILAKYQHELATRIVMLQPLQLLSERAPP